MSSISTIALFWLSKGAICIRDLNLNLCRSVLSARKVSSSDVVGMGAACVWNNNRGTGRAAQNCLSQISHAQAVVQQGSCPHLVGLMAERGKFSANFLSFIVVIAPPLSHFVNDKLPSPPVHCGLFVALFVVIQTEFFVISKQ